MSRPSAWHILASAAAAISLQGQARGQTPCWPLDCSQVPHLDLGQTWVPENPDWTIDRRPVLVIPTWTGSWCDNPLGLSPWWWYDHDADTNPPPPRDVSPANGIPDVFDWLLGQLNQAYNDGGWRRILLYLPAGTIAPQFMMASSHWWPMPQWKRDGFTTYVAPWIAAHPDANFGIYINITINDPCSLCQEGNPYTTVTWVDCASMNYCDHCPPPGLVGVMPCRGYPDSHAPDPHSAADACTFHQNVEPWLSLGAKEIWFDFAAYPTMVPGFLEFINSPIYHGRLKAGGEAVPGTDAALMKKAAWAGTSGFVDGQDPNHTWTFNPTVTEAGYWVQRNMMLSEMHGFLGRGWVIWIHDLNAPGAELAKRIYSAGVIHDIADFNGDGVVNSKDIDDFGKAYSVNKDVTTRCFNYVHGDLDQDGYVTWWDQNLFDMAYASSLTGQPISVDYGAPNPDSAMP
jgi:hypothetical protein